MSWFKRNKKQDIDNLKIEHSKDLADLYNQIIVEQNQLATRASSNLKEFNEVQLKLSTLLEDLKYGLDANQLISLNQFVKSFMEYGKSHETSYREMVIHYDKLMKRSKVLTQEYEKKVLAQNT